MPDCKPLTAYLSLLALFCLGLTLPSCAPKAVFVPEPLVVPEILDQEADLTEHSEAAYAYLLALDLERGGDPAGARDSLRRALTLDPNPFLSMELANSFWREGRTDETREALKEAIGFFPGDRGLNSALINAYLAENMIDEAIVAMDTYLHHHPRDILMRQELAGLLLQYGRFSHAADILLAVPESERTPELRILLARSKAGLGLSRQAKDQLLLVLRESPDNIEALAELAFLYENAGEFLEAEETYQRILDLRRDSEDVLLRLVQLNLTLNQPDKAMSYAMVHADQEHFVLEAALIFLRESLFDQAKTLLDQIPEDDGPPEADFYRALAAYDGDRDAEQALAYLGRIPEDHANYGRALSFQGFLLLQLDRPEDALDVAREGLERFPNMSDFVLLKAETLFEQGQEEQAAVRLEQARQRWPEDTDVLYRLGFLQEQMGQREEALRTMEDLIVVDPDHAEALNFIGYTLAEEGRDLERALVLIERSLELKPGSGHIVDSLAWVHYKMGNYEEAWKHIQSAVEIMSDDPTLWEHYGDIARALGKSEQARKGYRNALMFETKDQEAVQEKLDNL